MVQSVEKALALLNAVARHGDWIGVRDLARMTGLKPPTAQQLLKTLQKTGYLEVDENIRRYRIGTAAMLLGGSIDRSARLTNFVKPHVDAIYEEFKETTVALSLDRGVFRAIYFRQCVKELASSAPSQEDVENPHVMACGQALLAWLPPEQLSEYIHRHGIKDEAKFAASMERVRSQGFAELIDYNKSGVAAYAASSFDATGRPVLSIGWSIPLARFSEDLKSKVVKRLGDTAKAIDGSLSFPSRTA